MIKAVLLDLDNTLLRNPDAVFAPAYLALIDHHFAAHIPGTKVSQVMHQFITAASSGLDGTRPLQRLALALLTEATGRTTEDIQAVLSSFFEHTYPQLASYIQPIAGAAALIEALRAAKLMLVIATNPIYPLTAIRQRMAWARLPDDPRHYELVTAAETMHFAKPDPSYYGEIAARIGIEPDEALLIGDSTRNDILPARQIGMFTFQITEQGTAPAAEAHGSGTLQDFVRFTQQTDWRYVPQPALHPGMIAPQYRGNIGALYGLLEQLPAHLWQRRPEPDGWSILQILCYLRDTEETYQRYWLERILSEDDPFIAAQPQVQQNRPVCGEDGLAVAAQFVHNRQQTMRFLESLQPADWQRPARHSTFGRTTLLEMAYFTALHDRLRLNQLYQAAGWR